MDKLYTVKKVYEGLYKEKGSKFNSILLPLTSIDEVKEKIEKIKSEHSKSRHVCFAYRLGMEGDNERAFDAGEPNGSAGLPILNQLHSKQLTNVLLVVVRYFGGTKLGLSGLVTAYKEASKDVLNKAKLLEVESRSYCKITFPINELGAVERLIRSENWRKEDAHFGDPCVFSISGKVNESISTFLKLENLPNITFLEKFVS